MPAMASRPPPRRMPKRTVSAWSSAVCPTATRSQPRSPPTSRPVARIVSARSGSSSDRLIFEQRADYVPGFIDAPLGLLHGALVERQALAAALHPAAGQEEGDPAGERAAFGAGGDVV